MGNAALPKEQIAKFVANHYACDYQKYLQNYDRKYLNYRNDRFCNSDSLIFDTKKSKTISALATLDHQEWDTQCFGVEVAKVSELLGNDTDAKIDVLKEIRSYAQSKNVGLLTCRVAADDFTSLNALEKVGFKTTDAMNIFLWDNQQNAAPPPSGKIVIRPFDSADKNTRQILLKTATNAFRHSRIYNDPNFTPCQRNRFHKQLAEGFFSNPSALNLVAWVNNRPVGFVIGAQDKTLSAIFQDPIGYLWLIAVDPAHTGQGIGHHLLNHFLVTFSTRVRFIEVGTQIHNYAALNLYAHHGLKLVSALTTLHLWL